MIETVFITIVKISLSLFFPILLLAAFCLLFGKRYKQGMLHKLWLLLAVRLLIPVVFALPLAPIQVNVPTTPLFAADTTAASSPVAPASEILAQPIERDAPAANDAEQNSTQEHAADVVAPSVSPGFSILQVVCIVWMGGMLLLCTAHIIKYALYRRRLFRWNTPVRDDAMLALLQEARQQAGYTKELAVFYNPTVHTPMLIGFFKACILLPQKMQASANYAGALKHEMIHAKRKDIVWKAITLTAAIVHWFNPAAWLMLFMTERYTETSCDELVVKNTNAEYRLAYGQILLSSACGRSGPLAATLAGSKQELKNRLAVIAGKQNKRRGIMVLSLLLAALLLAGSLIAFNAMDSSSGQLLPEVKVDVFKKPDRKEWNLLILGMENSDDHEEDFYRADMILYLHYDVENDSVSILQIPRDAVLLPDDGPLRNIYQEDLTMQQNREKIADILSRSLGLPVDNSIAIDLAVLRDVIDTVGGVEMYIPYDVTDTMGNIVPQGTHRIDGATAEFIVRQRQYATGTWQQLEIHQAFYAAAFKTFSNDISLETAASLLQTFLPRIDTDLTYSEMLSLAVGFKQLKSAYVVRCPVAVYESALLPDKEALLTLINQYFVLPENIINSTDMLLPNSGMPASTFVDEGQQLMGVA